MLKSIELVGFKSFARKSELVFESRIAGIVGPNGSGKSNVAEGFRFVLGEQSMKSMRSKRGEDLIWGGSGAMPRANRAAVKVTFDNSQKVLDIDFPEVVLERVVYRDGQNEYLINGSKVRLKDVVTLLAGANIAGTGYQIISQGEADRILNASPRERREMVEDALGLKLYQHKKVESERKLEETSTNIEKVESLRRELAPHLKFLRKQVEKLERAREMKEELSEKLAEYLAREDAWVQAEGSRIAFEREGVESELLKIEQEMEGVRAMIPQKQEGESDAHLEEMSRLGGELEKAQEVRERMARELGRAEARAELTQEIKAEAIPQYEMKEFVSNMREYVEAAQAATTLEDVRLVLVSTQEEVESFSSRFEGRPAEKDEGAEVEVARIAGELAQAQAKEKEIEIKMSTLRAKAAKEAEEEHEAERTFLTLEASKRDYSAQKRALVAAGEEVARAKRAFEEEVREGVALLGADVSDWKTQELEPGFMDEVRDMQEKRRREVERLKIKIEESGVGNSAEIMKEFTQTKERDEFLMRELNDLNESAQTLVEIIEDLDQKIDERFQAGLVKINDALTDFFGRLFGGGDARLELEKVVKRAPKTDEEGGEIVEEEDPVRGLTIHVQLPRKKVKGLEILSGGERALTSIALIFAMSQVNPPPFLILDETDAALDEANSRRYADMVRALGERSQLILITHNRATMAAAGELYGVTMSNDGISKLLSVKLEEAERVAK